MELLNSRKGITPVIAIVLLLMVTVGAVGVVYTQFNSLVGNPNEELRQQQRDQDTRIRIAQKFTNKSTIETSGDQNIQNYGTMHLEIQNSGSVSRNTTSFVLTALTGESTAAGNCFAPGNSTIMDPKDRYICDTGIVFPKVTEQTRIEVLLTGSSKTWTATCQPRTTGATVC